MITPMATASQTGKASLTTRLVDHYSERIFRDSAAVGMVLVVIDNHQVLSRSLGTTKPGLQQRPRLDSLIRIASITKLMTSEVMVKMAREGKIKLTDPLYKYAPRGTPTPAHQRQRPITLLNLATHTSALPREHPGRKPTGTAVFTWPTKTERWQWLARTRLNTPPGRKAIYSNLAYDLLADALARAAGKPYSKLLYEKVTAPLGMVDTTLQPTAEQCARLMIAEVRPSECRATLAAAGSGGIYSTPRDILHWMQHFLITDRKQSRKPTAKQEQRMYFQRDDLLSLIGMDVPGEAAAVGLGWVYLAPKHGMPGIMQKTGGGGGFITYLAMVPEKNIAAFVVVTRSSSTKFTRMSDPVNQLLADLVAKRDNIPKLLFSKNVQ